jgi:hypothetical protein
VTGQGSTNLVYTILGIQTIIVIGFHHNCWWSSYQDGPYHHELDDGAGDTPGYLADTAPHGG